MPLFRSIAAALLISWAGLNMAMAQDPARVTAAHIHANGTTITAWSDGAIRQSDMHGANMVELYRFPGAAAALPMAASFDGTRILVQHEGSVAIFNAVDARPIRVIQAGADESARRAFLSPDGRRLILVDGDRCTVLMVDQPATPAAVTKVPDLAIDEATVLADGQLLVAGRVGRKALRALLLNPNDGTRIWSRDFPAFGGKLALSIAPDGKRLLVVAGGVNLLETVSGKSISELRIPRDSPLRSARWSADGKRLGFAWGPNWRVVDTADGRVVAAQFDRDRPAMLAPLPNLALVREDGNSGSLLPGEGSTAGQATAARPLLKSWNLAEKPILSGEQADIRGIVAVAPDGRSALGQLAETDQLFLVNLAEHRLDGCFAPDRVIASRCGVALARARLASAIADAEQAGKDGSGLPAALAAYLDAVEQSGLQITEAPILALFAVGSAMVIEDRLAEAREQYEARLGSRSPILRAAARAGIGEVRLAEGDPKAAARLLSIALGEFDTAPAQERASAGRVLIQLLRIAGDAEIALGHHKRAISLAERGLAALSPQDDARTDMLIIKARGLRGLGQRAAALDILWALFGTIDENSFFLARVDLEIAADYLALGNRAEADRYASRAIDIFMRTNSLEATGLVEALMQRGWARSTYADTLALGVTDLRQAAATILRIGRAAARNRDARQAEERYRIVFRRQVAASWRAANGTGTLAAPAKILAGGQTRVEEDSIEGVRTDEDRAREAEKRPSAMIFATLSPDGRRAMIASRDGKARLIDTASGEQTALYDTFETTRGRGPSFSADGKLLYVPLRGIVDPASGKQRDDSPYALLFGPAGAYGRWSETSFELRAPGSDPVALIPRGKLWDTRYVAAAANGQRFVLSSSRNADNDYPSETGLWDDTGKLIATIDVGQQPAALVDFTPGDRWLMLTLFDAIQLLRPIDGTVDRTLRCNRCYLTMSASLISKDGKSIAAWSAVSDYALDSPSSSRVALWRLDQGDEARLVTIEQKVTSVALSPDGEVVAIGDDQGTVHLYRTESGTRIGTFALHKGIIWSLAFTGDSNKLLTASEDGEAKLSDISGSGRSLVLAKP